MLLIKIDIPRTGSVTYHKLSIGNQQAPIKKNSKSFISLHTRMEEQSSSLSQIPTAQTIMMNSSNSSSSEKGKSLTAVVATRKRKKYNEACAECRKAHKACSGTKPCERCIKLGIGDTCKTLERKKRGKSSKRWYNYQIDQQGMFIPCWFR
jgi:hypothetical protein